MASTQAAVKSALKTALLARAGLSGVQVLYGEADEQRREAIWMGASQQNSTQEPEAFRKALRIEDYTLLVHCENGTKPTPEETEARAVALAAEVEAEVITNDTLSVTGVAWIRPAGVELRTTESEDGPVSVATVSLAVKARLTS
jgi:hypothetical protein